MPIGVFLVVVLLAGCSRLPKTAVVRYVVDGDTIVLDSGEKVRYLGIDTPEIYPTPQPWAREAHRYNEQLVGGKKIKLEYDEVVRDKYGRLLAYVWVGKEMVNTALLKEGLAYVFVIPPNEKYVGLLAKAQRQAMESKRGLWRYPGIIPPEEARKWRDSARAVEGSVCRVMGTGRALYLILRCDPNDYFRVTLPYTHLAYYGLDRYRRTEGKRLLSVAKIRCRRDYCEQVVRHPVQLTIEPRTED